MSIEQVEQQFDYSVNLGQAVLWQYDQAVNLLSLINKKQTWYNVNQQTFWDNYFNYIFWLANPDLTTSTSPDIQKIALFGLSVWSIILNLPLFIDFEPESNLKPNFGFNEYNPTYPTLLNSYLNFDNSNFSNQGQQIHLTPAQQQFLLLIRYFQLSNRGALQSLKTLSPTGQQLPFYKYGINEFLNWLCTNYGPLIGYTGTIYAMDGYDMTMTYVFTTTDFPPDLWEVMTLSDVFPRPAGVGIKFVVNAGEYFGFGQYYQNFGNGTFYNPFFS